jgi:hypothetical protein
MCVVQAVRDMAASSETGNHCKECPVRHGTGKIQVSLESFAGDGVASCKKPLLATTKIGRRDLAPAIPEVMKTVAHGPIYLCSDLY